MAIRQNTIKTPQSGVELNFTDTTERELLKKNFKVEQFKLLVCATVLAFVSAATAPTTDSTNTSTASTAKTSPPKSSSSTTTASSIASTTISIANGVVTASCTTGACNATANNATEKCCEGSGCTAELFKPKEHKKGTGNAIQACISTIVTLTTVVMVIIN
ncbi:hypothetical protein MAR_028579 [Mya arenaria]|uniref:Uncharacterized protein n=1 Tax=Mya arenaria TaxID=6604 RepID=A0ABY7DF43_MYAAR|nr:hypothetical protein MAR_028579 [Mya arenaria]